MTEEPVVFIVDDDESMRRALQRTISSVGWGVQAFESGIAFLDGFEHTQPGCVILDLRMPGLSGLDVQEQLLADEVDIPIIFITAFGEVPVAVQAIKRGAVEFLEKPFSSQKLLACLAEAIKRDIERRSRRRAQASLEERLSRLTAREREVLDYVVGGTTTKEIAAQLGIQPRTVEIHRHHVMQKMNVHSAVELVRLLLV